MAEPKKDSSLQVEKSEVWTNEQFEAFIDTELTKDPLHKDYPELFQRGEFCLPPYSYLYLQLITRSAEKHNHVMFPLQHPKSSPYGDNVMKEMHLYGSDSSRRTVC